MTSGVVFPPCAELLWVTAVKITKSSGSMGS
jgi:hypothetical protein